MHVARTFIASIAAGIFALASAAPCRASTPQAPTSRPSAAARAFTYDRGGIIRGSRDRKEMALVFTGGSFGEGLPSILDELAARHIKASFFVTGEFIRIAKHRPYLKRIIAEGHYLGPHSDQHLLYCPWEDRSRTLVTQAEFTTDLKKNIDDLVALGMPREQIRYFIPPYEWYNEQIVAWASEMGLTLINFTPGTRSNTDYLPDDAPKFIPSKTILRGILDHESRDPAGLSGFMLLIHAGAGPKRTDKLYALLGELIATLENRGYKFMRADELLSNGPTATNAAKARGAATRPAPRTKSVDK